MNSAADNYFSMALHRQSDAVDDENFNRFEKARRRPFGYGRTPFDMILLYHSPCKPAIAVYGRKVHLETDWV